MLCPRRAIVSWWVQKKIQNDRIDFLLKSIVIVAYKGDKVVPYRLKVIETPVLFPEFFPDYEMYLLQGVNRPYSVNFENNMYQTSKGPVRFLYEIKIAQNALKLSDLNQKDCITLRRLREVG